MAVRDFYRNRQVFVTGLSGFKGIWLASWLERLGAEVRGLALPPEPAMCRGWPGLHERWSCATVDVRDLGAVQRALTDARPEVLFHMAAQPLVRLAYRDPVGTFATNVQGTVHVLEAARQVPSVRAVVVVTSDKCYENVERAEGYREDEAFGGHDPYSASKGCAEIVTAAYRRSYGGDGWRVATVRAGNVIGGGDWAAERLVPDLVHSVLTGAPLLLRRPLAIRPWQHVLEPLSGYLLLAERLVCGDRSHASGWNFGPSPEDSITVRELAHLLVRHWGRGQVIEAAQPTGPREAHSLRLDSTKATRELGWRPLLSVAERVGWSVDWYCAWQHDPQSVWRVVADQIDRFEARIAACPSLALRWGPVEEVARAA